MAIEKLGWEFVTKVSTSFAQNFSYVAGTLMRYQSQYEKVVAKVMAAAKAEERAAEMRVKAADKAMKGIVKALNAENTELDRLNTKRARYLKLQQDVDVWNSSYQGHLTTTNKKIQEHTDILEKLETQYGDTAQEGTRAWSELSHSHDKTNETLKKLNNGFSSFFSMLTGGWAEGIVSSTAFGGMLTKLVPSIVSLSLVLNVAKLAYDGIRMAVRFAVAVFNTFWSVVVKVGTTLWNFAKSILAYVGNAIVTLGKNIANWLVEKFKQFIALPFTIAQKGLASLVDMFKQIFAVTAGVGLDRVLTNIANAIKDVGSRAWTAAVDFQSLKLRLQGLLQREIAGGETTQIPIYKTIVPSAAQLEALDDLNQKLQILQDKVTIAEQKYSKTGTLSAKVAVDSARMAVEAMEEKISTLRSGMSGTYKVMQALTTGTMSFADALPLAKEQVIELTDWISNWALKTKFNAVTIANAFTLAMSYGFSSNAAKQLVTDISQFTTGMGLGNEEFTRIIENFGQMVQQGKLTGTELRDLARGAFMPINKILGIMGENLGLDNMQIGEMKKKIQDLTSSGEISLEQFFKAFSQMVGEDFPNAVETMQVSWAVMMSNLHDDFVESIIGWRVITPIVDAIGARLNVLVNQLITPEMRKMWSAFGVNLAFVVDQFMTLFDTLTGGSGSRVITWMGGFITKINFIIDAFRSISTGVKMITDPFGQIWSSTGVSPISVLLKNLGITDLDGKKEAAIGRIITKIQNLWKAIANADTLLGKGQVISDFFNTEIWPVIRDWFTNVLFPGIKNLIATYGPGVISSLTTGIISALDTVRGWFVDNSVPSSPFGQFLTLIQSIMTYLGASATEAIAPKSPKPYTGLPGEQVFPQMDMGKTASQGALARVIENWNKLKDTMVSLAKDGIDAVNTSFNNFIANIIPPIDKWLSSSGLPWKSVKDIARELAISFLIIVGTAERMWNLVSAWSILFTTTSDAESKLGPVARIFIIIDTVVKSLLFPIQILNVFLLTTAASIKNVLDMFSIFTTASGQLLKGDWAGLKESMKKYGELDGIGWADSFIAAKEAVFKNTPILGPTSWQTSLVESGYLAGAGFAQSTINGFTATISAGKANTLGLVWGSTQNPDMGTGGSLYQSGIDLMDGFMLGFQQQNVIATAEWERAYQTYIIMLDAYYKIKSPSGLMQQKGVDIVSGLMFGMQSQWSVLMSWWQSAITEISKQIVITLDVQSPSKVMAGIGENIMLGLAKGIQSAGNTPWLAMRNTPLFAYARGGGNTSNNTYITNKNYNLGGVNTTRTSTSVIRDFELMRLME